MCLINFLCFPVARIPGKHMKIEEFRHIGPLWATLEGDNIPIFILDSI